MASGCQLTQSNDCIRQLILKYAHLKFSCWMASTVHSYAPCQAYLLKKPQMNVFHQFIQPSITCASFTWAEQEHMWQIRLNQLVSYLTDKSSCSSEQKAELLSKFLLVLWDRFGLSIITNDNFRVFTGATKRPTFENSCNSKQWTLPLVLLMPVVWSTPLVGWNSSVVFLSMVLFKLPFSCASSCSCLRRSF